MLYYLLKIVEKIICFLPENIAMILGKIFGKITWLLVPKKRKIMAIDNIKRSLNLDEKKAKEIAKSSWVRFGPMFVEVLRFSKIKNNLDKYVKIIGKENIDKANSYGKGGIIATCHSGNWELIGMILSQNGLKIAGVAQRQRNKDVNRFINECRAHTGMHITDKLDIKEMMKMLSDKYFIGLIMDQDGGSTGVIMEFLGKKASCVQGPAILSRYKDAPILPVFITEDKEKGSHILYVDEPIFTPRTKDKGKDVLDTLTILNKKVEDHIKMHPEEWFWLHDRWKYVNKNNIK